MKVITLVVMFILAPMSYAGTGGGLVTQILVHGPGGNGQGVVMFATQQNANKAACGTNNPTAWAISLEKQAGQAMFATLLSAQAQDKPVIVQGEGDCASWADRERPRYIIISS